MAAAIRIVPEQVIDFWREKVVPLQPFNAEHFSKRELRILEGLSAEYASVLSEKMIDITHAENGAWARVWADGNGRDHIIPYALAIAEDAPDREAVLQAAAGWCDC